MAPTRARHKIQFQSRCFSSQGYSARSPVGLEIGKGAARAIYQARQSFLYARSIPPFHLFDKLIDPDRQITDGRANQGTVLHLRAKRGNSDMTAKQIRALTHCSEGELLGHVWTWTKEEKKQYECVSASDSVVGA